jgi:uncharacterized Zn finger protein
VEPLDGNAIAGDLFEHFGAEMTAVRGACRHCGASGMIGELHVYVRAPGAVVRCRNCGNVVIVVVTVRDRVRVDSSWFEMSQVGDR